MFSVGGCIARSCFLPPGHLTNYKYAGERYPEMIHSLRMQDC